MVRMRIYYKEWIFTDHIKDTDVETKNKMKDFENS